MRNTLLLLLLATSLTPALSGVEYPVQLHRPASVGQEFFLSSRMEETHKLASVVGAKTLAEQKRNVASEIDARIKVLEIDPKGRITQATCTVSNCFRIDGEGKKELLPRETVVTASTRGETLQFSVDGKRVAEDVEKVLTIAMELKAVGPVDDEVFGTDAPKKIGDSWNIRAEPLLFVLRKGGLKVAKEDVQGRATLEQIVKVGGLECLEIASKAYIKKFAPQSPPEMTIKQAFGAFRWSGKYPLDASLGPLEETEEISVDFIAQGKPVGNLIPPSLKTTSVIKRTIKRNYLK